MTFAALGGVVSAAVAASCFDGGLALQALDAREVPAAHGLSPTLLTRLMRRKRWLAATGLAFAGWPFHLLALALAPLSLVQPTLALGLGLLLYLGHRLLAEGGGGAEGVPGAGGARGGAAPPW